MARILGIDPGSIKTGFGVIEVAGSRVTYLTSGIIRLPAVALPEKLKIIHDGVTEIITQYEPDEMAVEEVFFARDPRAALKLGQARGAAIVAGARMGLPVSEFSARTVKQSVVGTGTATKEQVQHMVVRLLKLASAPREDAADALAVALCHGQTLITTAGLSRVASVGGTRYAKGRLREITVK